MPRVVLVSERLLRWDCGGRVHWVRATLYPRLVAHVSRLAGGETGHFVMQVAPVLSLAVLVRVEQTLLALRRNSGADKAGRNVPILSVGVDDPLPAKPVVTALTTRDPALRSTVTRRRAKRVYLGLTCTML